MATFTVTTLNDVVNAGDGLTSLREAITLANATAAADQIEFTNGLSGTINLTSGDFNIAKNVTINGDTNGDGNSDVTISQTGANRIFDMFNSGTADQLDLDAITLAVVTNKAIKADRVQAVVTAIINGTPPPAPPPLAKANTPNSTLVLQSVDLNSTGNVRPAVNPRVVGEVVLSGDTSIVTTGTNSAAIGSDGVNAGLTVVIETGASLSTTGSGSAAISGGAFGGSIFDLQITGDGTTDSLSTTGANSGGIVFGDGSQGNATLTMNIKDAKVGASGAGLSTADNGSTLIAVDLTDMSSVSLVIEDSILSTAGNSSGVINWAVGDSSDQLIFFNNSSVSSQGSNSDLLALATGTGSITNVILVDTTFSAVGSNSSGFSLTPNVGDSSSDTTFVSGTSISTMGDFAAAFEIATGGITSNRSVAVRGTDFYTQGSDSNGVDIGGLGDGSAFETSTDSMTTITTMGDNSLGLIIGGVNDDAAMTVTIDGTTISTAGSAAHGLSIDGSIGDNSVASVNVQNVSTTTTGANATGFYLSAGRGAGSTVVIDVNDNNITASGANADGMEIDRPVAGTLVFNMLGGSIQGGSGSGAGLVFSDVAGAHTTIVTNTDISALSGLAILGGVGNQNINSGGTITGDVRLGAGNDTFTVSPSATVSGIIDLGSGNDIFSGGDGNETVIGGAGTDIIDGGAGSDTADYSTAGATVVVDLGVVGAQNTGGGGTDNLTSIENLTGSDFNDTLTGAGGANVLDGGALNDMLSGGSGADTLNGGDGDDTLDGGLSSGDVMNGGAGDDTILGGFGNDTIDGGADNDTVDYSGFGGNISVNLNAGPAQTSGGGGVDTITNVENIIGGAFADTLTGRPNDTVITGGAGGDKLFGLGGNDELHGGSANDNIQGGNGDDMLFGEADQDILTGGAGNDTLSGGGALDRLVGSADDDTLIGGGGRDILRGDSFDTGTMTNITGGNDTFVFNNISDSAAGGQRDIIRDLVQGEDIIDLTGIDAITGGGDNAFSFIGTTNFSGTAGELRYQFGGSHTIVSGDVDGDGTADFQIDLNGNIALLAGDFLL